MNEPRWLAWAREIRSIAQVGLMYATDKFDIERYRALSRVAAEIVSGHSDIKPEQVRDIFKRETAYPTPKLAVRACCVVGRGLLLVRETASGLWALPGGVVETLESPREAVVREVFEESGYQVIPKRLLAAYDRAKQSGVPVRYSNYCTRGYPPSGVPPFPDASAKTSQWKTSFGIRHPELHHLPLNRWHLPPPAAEVAPSV